MKNILPPEGANFPRCMGYFGGIIFAPHKVHPWGVNFVIEFEEMFE